MQNWNLNTIRQGLRTLVYPENCLICSALNQTVCDLCLQSWRKIPVRFQIENFNIYAVVPYDTFSSGVVLKAKEDRNKVAQNLMAEALATAIMQWRNANRNVQLLLVPIPSSSQAIRRRGESFLHPILDRAVKICTSQGASETRWESILIHQKKVKDQSKLSFSERSANLENAFKVSNVSALQSSLEYTKIILIDDVVTTGATLLSAARALSERNMTVLGAAAVCASAHRLLIR
jgi:ComF family protein